MIKLKNKNLQRVFRSKKLFRFLRRAAALFYISILLLAAESFAFAKEINFEITVDRNKAGLGQPVQLYCTFNNTQNFPALELPAIAGFQSRYLGPSTSMSIINGRMSSSITHVYSLLSAKIGTFKVGPFKFEHNGDTYNSNSINIEVLEPGAGAKNQANPEEQAETKDLSERIFLIIQLSKNKIYLNEIAPVTIKLFVNKLGVRDIQFPQFAHDGFSLGEFEQPKQYQDVVGGINYEVIEFNTAVFGLKPGEFRLGPANLQCNLIVKKQNRRQSSPFDGFFDSNVFDDFFDRYETYPYIVKSADMAVTVLPLPQENKPADFTGALGNFNFEVSAGPGEVQVGDPLTLKIAARGQGNFNTVNLPKINTGNDFKAYEPQVKQDKDAKTSEQVLIPLNAAINEIPAVSFSFFNTQTAKYETIVRGPFPIKIVKAAKEEELRIIEAKQPASVANAVEEKFGRDIIYIKDSPGQLRKKGDELYKNKIFLGFQIIPFLLYLFTALIYVRNRRLKTDLKYARQLAAPRKAGKGIVRAKSYLAAGSAQDFYDALFATLQEYLGDKFHFPSKGITISFIDEQLKNKRVAEEILTKLKDIFKECDMVRYAASELTKENMRNSLRKLEEIIDYFQRQKAD